MMGIRNDTTVFSDLRRKSWKAVIPNVEKRASTVHADPPYGNKLYLGWG